MAGWLQAWRALPKAQRWILIALAALLLVVQIDQPFPRTAPLHHIPTALLLIAAPLLLARWPLRTAELGCIAGFLALHTFGARWTYTNMPYDAWSEAALGVSIDALLGWERNNYDRIVHFAFGALAVAPIVGLACRRAGAGAAWSASLAVGFVLAAGGLYEIFEWGISLAAPASMADDYNGQQGDMWDAQKDMALAGLGALIAALWSVRAGLAARVRIDSGDRRG
ncbi:DUF2238 domain-containing protein [Sphingomonas sanxanigenens]|uniref:Membrane protein YjdF n=1 Tax=Sphingomonas sanxanigenens DSM 19645 = NX02 TaxID=1123269 RepID=W0AB12_9SPHN|nr:DUF2238 domain-containing protein [Sphingomonas sanxanigenens]AHE54296.1 hypothetical protein NX02_12990 [Sphingomonas sanxanigenens DSM 19645 = NX02]